MKIDWRPTAADLRAAFVEFVLTTFFFWTVFSLVRWGFLVPGLRVRVVVVSMLVGLVIVGFATSRPGRFTGCHMNPAITVGLYAFGTFPARRVVPYLVAQSAGSVAAAALTWLAWGSAASSSVVRPGSGWSGPAVFVAEAATLAIIVATMCWMSARRPAWTWHGPWIVGMQFGVQGALLGTLTGGSANPMRQLGPALLAGHWHLLATYLLAPIAGAAVAGLLSRTAATGPRPSPTAAAPLSRRVVPSLRSGRGRPVQQLAGERPLARAQARWILIDQHARGQRRDRSARRGPRAVTNAFENTSEHRLPDRIG